MSAPADVLNQMVPPLVRLARRPGALLLEVAGFAVGSFLLLAVVHGVQGNGPSSWVAAVVAIVLALPVVDLALRRHRLQARTEGLDVHTVTGSRELLIRDGEPAADRSDSADAFAAALAEHRIRAVRFLPRIEATQRAALAAVGGPVNAPYLKDDLRVTLLALLGTLAAIPLGTLGAIITAIALLS
jgi:hypothetical protein